MPELPEVETVARQLDSALKGKKIATIAIHRQKSASSSLDALLGKKIISVFRKAKYLCFDFDATETSLVAHLKMTGQFIYVPTSGKRVVGGHPTADWVDALPSNHTRIVMGFADGSTLFFNDMRVFGWMKVITIDERTAMINDLPPDVIDPEFTIRYLSSVIRKSTRAIKLVILDQTKMGGMGNIYANDALWLAKINPSKSAQTLSKKEIISLHRAMRKVLLRGIELGGASESTYKHINGMGGKYQEEFLIYKKGGEVCVRCGGVIEKFKLGGRGTYVCEKCQQ
jgi:formamidopyrimidine-DNA glycosylase